MISAKLTEELDSVLSGTPWHGKPVVEIIEQSDSEKAHRRDNGPHSMADILLHMIAWTEETIERLRGKFASDPVIGDWPDPEAYKWDDLAGLFIKSNEHLREMIVRKENDFFHKKVNDDRYPDLAEKHTYEQLVRGLIQHHIYHSGQIALLNKQP